MPTTAALILVFVLAPLSGTGDPRIENDVDVGHWQGDVDWKLVAREGIDSALAKATEDLSSTDPRSRFNWREMRKAGLARGDCHYLDPARDGVEQARHFLHAIGPLEPGDLLPVADVRRMKRESNVEIANVLETFTDQVHRDTRLDCILSVSTAFRREHLLPARATARTRPRRIMEFDTKEARRLEMLPPRTIRRYTKRGRVAGVQGMYDRSRGRDLDSIRTPATSKSRSKGS
ncbi:MAG: hypothetical protein GY895_23330 [Phycisphaera sp.]|nr:hypothetical protein [Phycisphaera sp.]